MEEGKVSPIGGPRPLYASTIHQIINLGDLAKMKALAHEIDEMVAEVRKLDPAHKELKAAIGKLESRK
jgi:Domain of unknown function (DUF1843)